MTINSLCLFSITEFLDDMMSLKKEFGYKPKTDIDKLILARTASEQHKK